MLSSFLQQEGLWQVRTPHFTAGTQRKPRFLPEQLPHVGRKPPTRSTHTSKQDVLKKQPLPELVTFISKPTLTWIYVSSDYSITCCWSLLSWPGSKGSSVPSISESEIGKKMSGYQDVKQILKNRKKTWLLGGKKKKEKKAVYSWRKPLLPNPDSWAFSLLLNLLHSSRCGQADPPAVEAGPPFPKLEEPALSQFSGRWLCQAAPQQVSAVTQESRQVSQYSLSAGPSLPLPFTWCASY